MLCNQALMHIFKIKHVGEGQIIRGQLVWFGLVIAGGGVGWWRVIMCMVYGG